MPDYDNKLVGGQQLGEFARLVKNAINSVYTKPATGIPESHLSSDVQQKLNVVYVDITLTNDAQLQISSASVDSTSVYYNDLYTMYSSGKTLVARILSATNKYIYAPLAQVDASQNAIIFETITQINTDVKKAQYIIGTNYYNAVYVNIMRDTDVSASYETTGHKVTSLTQYSTDTQYPSAKAVYDELSGKSNSGHSHTKSDITDFPGNLLTLSTQGRYDIDTCYDGKVWLVANGTHCPSGSQYGSLFMMPYRQASGNTSSDYGVQIFLPNGDDSTKPNSMFYRTSTKVNNVHTWNPWQEVSTTTHTHDRVNGYKIVVSSSAPASGTSNDIITFVT